MKKLTLLIILGLFANLSFAQDFSKIQNYDFTDEQKYKEAESLVLETTQFLFDTPFDKNDLNRLHATTFILKWMEGTPDHTFNIDNSAVELTKGNNDLFGMYIAGMARVVLENKSETLADNTIHDKVAQYLVDYSFNENNNMKPTKALKKLKKSS